MTKPFESLIDKQDLKILEGKILFEVGKMIFISSSLIIITIWLAILIIKISH